jgi:hypothetical protein
MKPSELKAGRTFGVTLQHGDEFMASLAGAADTGSHGTLPG